MKKVTKEAMKEFVDDLFKSVGTPDFGKGKVYYKEGNLILSTKPLTAPIYILMSVRWNCSTDQLKMR